MVVTIETYIPNKGNRLSSSIRLTQRLRSVKAANSHCQVPSYNVFWLFHKKKKINENNMRFKKKPYSPNNFYCLY